jgi:hypothetical protein
MDAAFSRSRARFAAAVCARRQGYGCGRRVVAWRAVSWVCGGSAPAGQIGRTCVSVRVGMWRWWVEVYVYDRPRAGFGHRVFSSSSAYLYRLKVQVELCSRLYPRSICQRHIHSHTHTPNTNTHTLPKMKLTLLSLAVAATAAYVLPPRLLPLSPPSPLSSLTNQLTPPQRPGNNHHHRRPRLPHRRRRRRRRDPLRRRRPLMRGRQQQHQAVHRQHARLRRQHARCQRHSDGIRVVARVHGRGREVRRPGCRCCAWWVGRFGFVKEWTFM